MVPQALPNMRPVPPQENKITKILEFFNISTSSHSSKNMDDTFLIPVTELM